MNWQTQDLLDEAKRIVSDVNVFSPGQITLLIQMIDRIDHAIDNESDCIRAEYSSRS